MVSAKKVCSLLRVLNLHIIRNHVIETILTHAFVNFNQPNQEGVGAGGGGVYIPLRGNIPKVFHKWVKIEKINFKLIKI